MLSLILSKRSLLFLTIIFCFVNEIYAESLRELPQIEWERRFGNDKFRHMYRAAALSRETSEMWIAVRLHSADDLKSWNMLLWKLNQKGEKVKEVDVKTLQKGENPGFTDIKHLTILENGDLLFVGTLMGGQTSIVKMGVNGDISLMKQIGVPGDQISITKIVPTADHHFVLIGGKSHNAIAVKVDATGKTPWEKALDRGKTEFFFDGASTKNGGIILVGNSWSGDPFFAGPSVVWVVRFDPHGNIQSETVFPGRYASVARGQDQNYAIVYDKSDSASQDVWVQAINEDLKDLWRTQVLTVERGMAKFKIAPVPSGGFVVVGSKNFNLWVSRLDTAGKAIWSYLASGSIERRSPIFDLLFLNDAFFIFSSMYSENEKRQTNNKIGIIKFLQK